MLQSVATDGGPHCVREHDPARAFVEADLDQISVKVSLPVAYHSWPVVSRTNAMPQARIRHRGDADRSDEERVRGGHHLNRKRGVAERVNLQCDDGDAKPYQVRQVRRLIHKYKLGRND